MGNSPSGPDPLIRLITAKGRKTVTRLPTIERLIFIRRTASDFRTSRPHGVRALSPFIIGISRRNHQNAVAPIILGGISNGGLRRDTFILDCWPSSSAMAFSLRTLSRRGARGSLLSISSALPSRWLRDEWQHLRVQHSLSCQSWQEIRRVFLLWSRAYRAGKPSCQAANLPGQ